MRLVESILNNSMVILWRTHAQAVQRKQRTEHDTARHTTAYVIYAVYIYPHTLTGGVRICI